MYSPYFIQGYQDTLEKRAYGEEQQGGGSMMPMLLGAGGAAGGAYMGHGVGTNVGMGQDAALMANPAVVKHQQNKALLDQLNERQGKKGLGKMGPEYANKMITPEMIEAHTTAMGKHAPAYEKALGKSKAVGSARMSHGIGGGVAGMLAGLGVSQLMS
jgi:hypothetical protein